MAFIQYNFNSEALHRQVEFKMLLPNDSRVKENNVHFQRPAKTLCLLHGFTNSNLEWLLYSNIPSLSEFYNLAVIMPSAENSFYLDMPGQGFAYAKYVGEELLGYARKTFGLSEKREDTFIGGISMGGFGALHTGLTYPDTFSRIMALSSALIIHNVEKMTPGFIDQAADYDYYRRVFGDPKYVAQSKNNPERLLLDLEKEGRDIPGLYLACGTEDPLLSLSREFVEFLEKEGFEHFYKESAGDHNFQFWNQYLEPAIRWMLEGEE